MSLLYTSSLKLKIFKTRSFDLELLIMPTVIKLFDNIIELKMPAIKYYDIILSPVIDVTIVDFEKSKKGDNPYDFILSDTDDSNSNIMNMNAIGRNLSYQINKSDQFARPLGMVDEFKPITNPVNKIHLDDSFRVLKFKYPNNANFKNVLNSNIIGGILVVRYKSILSSKTLDDESFTKNINYNSIIKYGTRNDIDVPINTRSNIDYYEVYATWINVTRSGNWSFALDAATGAQLFIDNELVLSSYGRSTISGDKSVNIIINLSTGLHKVVVRHEGIGTSSDKCTLYYTEPSGSNWNIFSDINISNHAKLQTYIPSEDILTTMEFVLNPLKVPPPVSELTLLNNPTINKIYYIFIKDEYYYDIKSIMSSLYSNVNSSGTPIVSHNPTLAPRLNDNNSYTFSGWFTGGNTSLGNAWFGYTFNTPISGLTKVEWIEESPMPTDTEYYTEGLFGALYRSREVVIEITFSDLTVRNIRSDEIDIERSFNVKSVNSKNVITKTIPRSKTTVHLSSPMNMPISTIKVKRMDFLGNIWQVITELNIYVTTGNEYSSMNLITKENIDFNLNDQLYTPIKFEEIPVDIGTDFKTVMNKEDVYKSRMITLYKDINNSPNIYVSKVVE